MRRTRKMTNSSTTTAPIRLGMPTSSIKPVFGSAVVVGRIVVVNFNWAAWVNKAATVAVRVSAYTATPAATVLVLVGVA